MIALKLAALASHYYRPNFSEGQAKVMIRDMVDDLSAYPVGEVDAALNEYRKGLDKYFPRSGQIIAIIEAKRKDRRADERDNARGKVSHESRPLRWWFKPKKLWAMHWREEDIPADQREFYHQWRAAREAAE